MRQTLHIFRKDVRALRYEVVVVLILTVMFTWNELTRKAHPDLVGMLAMTAAVLLPVGWLYLIALVVHQESLVGDRQFWLTRPYSWKGLLAAKALFVVVFVNVPLFLSDWISMTALGYPPSTGVPHLLLKQVPSQYWSLRRR